MHTVLIVDDSHGTLDLIERCVHRITKNTFSALDGQSAWELFQQQSPDLVITDYKMPGINGIELAQLIRTINKDCPIILVTGYDDMDEAITTQFKNIFPKPFPIERFQSAVRRLLGIAGTAAKQAAT